MAQRVIGQRTRPAGERLINRELSRLDFENRVLALAEDRALPLLERVRFLAISGRNLDEIFSVRVAGLKDQQEVDGATSQDGMQTSEQLRQIRRRVCELVERQTRLLRDQLQPALAEQGMAIVGPDRLDRGSREHFREVFERTIFPILTPLAVDPAHPFPYVSNLSLNLAVSVRDPLRRVQRFARVKVPPLLPRFLPVPEGGAVIPVEEVIGMHLQSLFPGMEIVDHKPFRVTRDADLDLVDGEAEDLMSAIQMELRRQRRHGRAVRLEVHSDLGREVGDLLMRELELTPDEVYRVDGLLDLGGLWALLGAERPELKAEPWTPVTQPRLRAAVAQPGAFFAAVAEKDILVHHPYDSFATSVEAFIAEAARDPKVLAIKMTLYRTSGPASAIARSLMHAAESGKQVVALVELKARGDEQANIAWAEALEEAGVHVVYGVVGLKTHAKVTLVLRETEGVIHHFVHIGTGNYNTATAHAYEDIGVFTADASLGQDVSELFNTLTGYSRQRKFRRLLVAPTTLRPRMLELIRREAEKGERGRIVIKVNNLVDAEIIEELYRASQAGARIDLIVRSICCLRPGVEGLSEHIQVRSLVGRYLEHSRIFAFGEEGDRRIFLGSSDMMERNLDRRVEAVAPVLDPDLADYVERVLELALADDALAWSLQPDGSWRKLPGAAAVNLQSRLQELALARAGKDLIGA